MCSTGLERSERSVAIRYQLLEGSWHRARLIIVSGPDDKKEDHWLVLDQRWTRRSLHAHKLRLVVAAEERED